MVKLAIKARNHICLFDYPNIKRDLLSRRISGRKTHITRSAVAGSRRRLIGHVRGGEGGGVGRSVGGGVGGGGAGEVT